MVGEPSPFIGFPGPQACLALPKMRFMYDITLIYYNATSRCPKKEKKENYIVKEDNVEVLK